MHIEWIQALTIVATSVGAAFLALALLSVLIIRRDPARRPALQPALEPTVFLFDEEELVDATGPAQGLIDALPMAANDWARLSQFLSARFDDVSVAMAQLATAGRIELTGRREGAGRPPVRLMAESVGGLARITLSDPEAEGRGVLVDGFSHRALEEEVDHLRTTLDRAPVLVWREDEAGALTWANRAYLQRSGAIEPAELAIRWPLPRLFQLQQDALVLGPRRMRIDLGDDKAAWFDCHSFAVDGGSLHFAVPADATVRAERALRDFVQTLTKTFADLPIGLAIFDRQRQLQLFNPALIDLTQLGAEFLSMRPTLYAFLDRLREARMMPEPRDYRSWRQQMTELEQAASSGFHSETWTLPSGQTYRVTGRPHPDGAVAFLFEDISSEISLTRRFRAEIEQGHEVVDLIDEAVAVFSPSGELTLSNAAYDRLWGVEPSSTLGQVTLIDAVRVWQGQCEASDLWSQARAFSTRIGTRTTIEGVARRVAAQDEILCRFRPMSGGAMLASFVARAPAPVSGNSPGKVVTALDAH